MIANRACIPDAIIPCEWCIQGIFMLYICTLLLMFYRSDILVPLALWHAILSPSAARMTPLVPLVRTLY